MRREVRLTKILSNYWWLALFFAAIITFLIFFLTKDNSQTYSVTTKIFVSSSSTSALANIYDAPYADRAVKTISALITNDQVLSEISSQVGLPKVELRKDIKSKNVIGTQIIEISVIGKDQEVIRQTATLYPKVLQTFLQDIQKDTQEQDRIKVSVAEGAGDISKVSLSEWQILLLVAFGSLIFSIALIYIIEFSDSSIKGLSEFGNLGIKQLGSFGNLNKTSKTVEIINHEKNNFAAEMLREVRTNITSIEGKDKKVIVVTSSKPKEGKTLFVSSLGILLADTGKRVAIIDADLRAPFVHKVFGFVNEAGLTDYINQNGAAKGVLKRTDFDNLLVISSGSRVENPSETLSSDKMEGFIKNLQKEYKIDYILIDTPPLGVITDAAILSKIADGTIIVAEEGKTKIGDIARVKEAIKKAGGQVLGGVLTKVKGGQKTYYYRSH